MHFICISVACCCVRTAFPPRTYADREQSMTEAELAPSATLFVAEGPQRRLISSRHQAVAATESECHLEKLLERVLL